MVKTLWRASLGCGLLLSAVAVAQAQTQTQAPAQAQAPTQTLAASLGIFAYPEDGQTPEKIQEDDAHCYKWAGNYSGEDPLSIANTQAAAQPDETGRGQVAGGAAAGAAAGVIIGDTGESAAKGAAIGAVGGGIARRRQERKADDQREEAQQQAQKATDQFIMSFESCLRARGYSVQ